MEVYVIHTDDNQILGVTDTRELADATMAAAKAFVGRPEIRNEDLGIFITKTKISSLSKIQ